MNLRPYRHSPLFLARFFCDELFAAVDSDTRCYEALCPSYTPGATLAVGANSSANVKGREAVLRALMDMCINLKVSHKIGRVEADVAPFGDNGGCDLFVRCWSKITVNFCIFISRLFFFLFLFCLVCPLYYYYSSHQSKPILLIYIHAGCTQIDKDTPRNVLDIFTLVMNVDVNYPTLVCSKHQVVWQDFRPVYLFEEQPIPLTENDNWEDQFRPPPLPTPEELLAMEMAKVGGW